MKKNHRQVSRWLRPIAALTAAVLMVSGSIGVLAGCGGDNMENGRIDSEYAVAQASYPVMPQYPNEEEYFGRDGVFDSEGFSQAYEAWESGRNTQSFRYDGFSDGLDSMFIASAQQFLSGAEGKNRVCSPLNVYMALCMLCEISDGRSRQQILDLMGAESIEEMRKQSSALWNANYCSDGAVQSLLANSIWLNERIEYNSETLELLASEHHASSFSGPMGTEDYDKALREWLNTQTDGLLSEQAEGISMDARTVIALASTINYRAKWRDEFYKGATEPDVFFTPDGEITCDFMNMGTARNYYWSDRFSAVSLGFNEGGRMILVLPDEGISPEDIVSSREDMDEILSGLKDTEHKHLTVNLSVPKFDVCSDISLIDGLKALGVTDVFSFEDADFSPLADGQEMAVTNASHAARVMVDEEGCVAVAYTVMSVCGACMPPEEEVDLTFDRPFVFAILNRDDMPLFAGIVNTPV